MKKYKRIAPTPNQVKAALVEANKLNKELLAKKPDERVEELEAKNHILKQLTTVITNQLDDKQMIIELLMERANVVRN